MNRVNDFLDKYILPWPVRFLTFRFVILLTMALLIPLLLYANRTSLVLAINSYLNTMSVAVSSIVLLYATLSEANQKRIAELQEKRAQEDHAHVTEMHQIVMEMVANQHEELEDLKATLAAMQGKVYRRKKGKGVVDLQELHVRGSARYEAEDVNERLARNLHSHHLAEATGKDLNNKKKADKKNKRVISR